MTPFIPNVVSIAGVDPSGGAGVLADLKTFSALGAYGCAVVTALTAQNTVTVNAVHAPPAEFLARQIDTLFADVKIHAVKLGMLGNAEIVRTVAERLGGLEPPYVVCDPVMVAKSGDHLLERSAVAMVREALLPQTFMLTPNLPEAEVLVGRPIRDLAAMREAAAALRGLGVPAVLLKGGHLETDTVTDLLVTAEGVEEFASPRIATRHTHGTGCTLASAMAAGLAQGMGLRGAVVRARAYVRAAIAAAPGYGAGHGPLDHGITFDPARVPG